MIAAPPIQLAPPNPAAPTACSHCGLPVPAGLVERGAAEQFCCGGCRAARRLIDGCGLGRYYDLRSRYATRPAGRSTGSRFAEFDSPVFARLHTRPGPGADRRVDLWLEGLHCAACVWLLERLPRLAPGVREARVNLGDSRLTVTYDPAVIALSELAAVIDALGYRPHAGGRGGVRARRAAEDRRLLVRLGVAGALAGNIMIFAFALYGGTFAGMDPAFALVFRLISAALGVVCLAWPGQVFFRGAIASVRTGRITLDVPIALGLGVGGAWGLASSLTGRGEIYFDSISGLVFLLLAGRYIQHRQQRWAARSVELAFSLTDSVARRVGPSGVAEVPVEALAVGDLAEVLPGASIPADGTVESGRSDVDRSILTGEPKPVPVSPGDAVAGGTVNVSSPILVRVEATGEQTRAGRLMRLVEEAAARRPRVQTFNDRVAGWFVAAVGVVATATVAGWWAIDPATAIDNTAAVLIVACPCALGIAAPLIYALAIGRAARRGIIIKGADALEAMHTPATIFLDKTGTVTAGRPGVVAWTGDESVRGAVAAMESRCTHPAARALAAAASTEDSVEPVAGVRQQAGGVTARWRGRDLSAGSRGFVAGRGPIDPAVDAAADSAVAAGLTPIFIALDGSVVAVAAVGDHARPEAPGVIDELRRRGARVRLLSGDDPAVARAVGRGLGLAAEDCLGGVSPEEKLAIVRAAAARGPTVMVGDGVNDAAALAAATVGVAAGSPSEAALASADAALGRAGLRGLVEIVDAARSCRRALRATLAASIGYNIITVSLAVAGLIHPIVAALVMPASSLTVLAISISSRAFRGDRPGHDEPSAGVEAPGLPCR